jgi:iduronate 2-sulfatase
VDGKPPFNKTNGKEAVMGYSIRTDEWRYTEWVVFDRDTATPDWSVAASYGRELYSHTSSPVPDASFDYENENVAEAPEQQERVADMREMLRAGWRAALPKANLVPAE